MKKVLVILLAFLLFGCQKSETIIARTVIGNQNIYELYPQAKVLKLSDDAVLLDDVKVEEFDYCWHCDPTKVHDDVDNSPAEYYTGQKPEGSIYIAHDIIYYPKQNESLFRKENYDDETEWISYYRDGVNDSYVFSTLPVLGNEIPSNMMHGEKEAYDNPVLHIKEAGTYILEGVFKGQINIEVEDEEKVTIVLNGVDVNCTVGPALIIENCLQVEDSQEEFGAKVYIGDGTVNNFTGSNVYRILKTKYKSEGSAVQKKAYKIDGAFYSKPSLAIYGNTGILNITSTTFEGLDSEMHLTINGGNINIYTQDDGINVNEDDVSIFTMNNGYLTIFAGLGNEGDGVDSNGYIVVNGGTVVTCANPRSDNGLDSSCGTTINGGNVVALGSNMGGSAYSIYVNGENQYDSEIGNEPFGPGQFHPGQQPPEGFGPKQQPPENIGPNNSIQES